MCSSPNPHILYVDDNHDACEMMGIFLHSADNSLEVTAVSTAQKALTLIDNQPIALFILDSSLPEMSGVELCRLIRETDTQTPIIFYSGMTREIDRNEAFAAGANEYLTKPNDLEKLPETAKRLLNI